MFFNEETKGKQGATETEDSGNGVQFPIQISPEDWAKLEPLYRKMHEGRERLSEIVDLLKDLHSESKMIMATQAHNRARFWRESARLYPETEKAPVTIKAEDGSPRFEKSKGEGGKMLKELMEALGGKSFLGSMGVGLDDILG